MGLPVEPGPATGRGEEAAQQSGRGGLFSLSFDRARRPASRGLAVQPREEQRRELVTGLEGGRLETADGAAPARPGKLVVPKQEDNFQLGAQGARRFNAGRFLPKPEDPGATQTNEERFVVAAPEAQKEVTYGLQTRQLPTRTSGLEQQANGEEREAIAAERGTNGTEQAANSMDRGANRAGRRAEGAGAWEYSREWEAAKLKADLEVLPEVRATCPAPSQRSHPPTWALPSTVQLTSRLHLRGKKQGAIKGTKQSAHTSATKQVAALDAYEAMPISMFGEALMRGMGWEEGKGVGRNAKQAQCPPPVLGQSLSLDMANSEPSVVEAKEFVPRPAGLGLGATPQLPTSHAKRAPARPGNARGHKPDLVYYGANGQPKHVKGLDDKLVERELPGPRPSKAMRLVSGPHAGLLCMVLAVEPQVEGHLQRAKVRLQASGEAVSVRTRDLGETWERPANESLEPSKKSQANRDDGRHEARPSSRDQQTAWDRPRSGGESGRGPGRVERGRKRAWEQEEDLGPLEHDARGGGEAPWLAMHIRVKIVDKALQRGRLYLKKAEVVDVPSPMTCALHLVETGETLADVPQIALETVVPRAEGARVLVVRGPARGQRGRLLHRNTAAGAAAVQLAGDLSVVKLAFDDVCEFVGEYGEEE